MKTITIFKRKVNIALLSAVVVLAGAAGCKKGTFDINGTNPNSPSTVLPKYSLAASLSGTASLVHSGNQDMIDNWMGYWTQSGAYTPSNTFVLYQMNSSTATGNWDAAYNNLSNYNNLITTVSADPTLANYKAIGMLMTAFVYQRIVDLYNKAPFTAALVPNSTFSYPYDDGATIYKGCIAKIDAAVALIKANPGAVSPGNYDIMFGGNMSMWVKFANTLKLKMLMRQTASSTNGSLGDGGVKAALSGYSASDFLGAGEDASINPGYSSAADNQENPLYIDVVKTSTGNPGYNEKYFRANKYGVDFYSTHNDPRLAMLYLPTDADGLIHGRVYGSQNGNEANSVISGLTGYGSNASAKEAAPMIPAFESLFLVAEAQQRGYISGTVSATYEAAVEESFRILGSDATTADTYMAQADPVANFELAPDPITAIITQKWAACNSIDALESYSDWRRLNIPAKLPVSIYPGVTAAHIPYRLPYPNSEINYNSANVPDGGTGTEALTSKIFWMP